MTEAAEMGAASDTALAGADAGGEATSQPSLGDEADRQFDAIREALRERRQALGLSMSELARRVGVSPSMVSQIERGNTLPSVATLFALAAALGATVDTFFDPVDGRELAEDGTGSHEPVRQTAGEDRYVVRAAERAHIDIKGGVRWERLTPMSHDEVEFLELVYAPLAESDASPYRHPGIEMVLVLEGAFSIDIGFESYDLRPGDSITFASSLPHRYVNPLDTTSRAVTVLIRDALGGVADGLASQVGRRPSPSAPWGSGTGPATSASAKQQPVVEPQP